MHDVDDSMALCGIRTSWKVTGVGGAVTGAGEAASRVDGAVTRAAGAGAMRLCEDVPLAVTTVWARTMLEPPPGLRRLPLLLLL